MGTKGKEIPKAKRLAIMTLRGERTASEIAQDMGVSERSVIRIWQEGAIDTVSKEIKEGADKVNSDLEEYGHHHAITPEMVQMITVKQYLHLTEAREYYRAMRDAYPTNCAWGNLEEKYNRQINDILRIMGNWFGLEREKEPLTSTGIRNRDLTDFDIGQMARILEAEEGRK